MKFHAIKVEKGEKKKQTQKTEQENTQTNSTIHEFDAKSVKYSTNIKQCKQSFFFGLVEKKIKTRNHIIFIYLLTHKVHGIRIHCG